MKILVVEDEHRIATYIKKGLELKAYVVDVVYDGEAGVDLASDESYNVIILDRMLPKLDGLEVCRKLRAMNNHTPVLLLTAKTLIEDRVEGLDAGADDYLGKPFAFSELLARVKALTRRPQSAQALILKAGSLSMDMTANEVKRAGKTVRFSKKEYALLEFFLRHPNQTLSAEQLTEQVWSYDSEVLPNTAQVYVGYLRKKIDGAFPQEKPLIQTVRGFGYKLVSQ